jgi:MazG family protein
LLLKRLWVRPTIEEDDEGTESAVPDIQEDVLSKARNVSPNSFLILAIINLLQMNQSLVSQRFLELVEIMDTLREKCPWDKKQTIHSLRSNTIEELYELVDSIMEEDWDGIKEELGDIMLHVLFYAKIGSEQGKFTLDEVMDGISKKLIHRHPHIYGDVKVENEDDVKRNWEQLKLQEGQGTKTILSGVPNSLPSMVKALRIQEKVKHVGFEWENKEQVWDKVEEEIGEFKAEIAANNQEKMEQEFGDVLFSMINYARFLNIDPETALEKTNKKFKHRFELMEKYAKENGLDLAKMSLMEKEALWQKMK